jgi:Ni/Co efflux regulator RcnB
MKRIATAAFALCLMSGTSALAQDNQHHDDSSSSHDHSTGGPHGPSGGGPHGPPTGPTPQGHTVHGNTGPQTFTGHPSSGAPNGFSPEDRTVHGNNGPQTFTGHPSSGAPNGFSPEERTVHENTGSQNWGQHHNGAPANYRPAFGAPGVHPGGPRPHYNPQYFPRTFNLGVRFQWRGGNWSGPQGYYYRQWSYGQTLPWGWFGPQWWINDYWDYELPVPPYGYEWVRNGPDALLVDAKSGEVVEVVPGVFY